MDRLINIPKLEGIFMLNFVQQHNYYINNNNNSYNNNSNNNSNNNFYGQSLLASQSILKKI